MYRIKMTFPRAHTLKRVVRIYLLVLSAVCSMAVAGFSQQTSITPKTALRSYLDNGDQTYTWEIKDSLVYDKGTIFQVLLTSQRWREHTWKHQLNVIIPNEVTYDGGLLFISSGRMD